MSLALDLCGHIAVVTGAGGQLGRVIARRLGECGADVAVHYHRSAETAEAVASDIRAMGRRSVAVQADITDIASVSALREEIIHTLGHVDIVVDAAVAQYQWTTLLEQDLADYESQFRTCVMQNVIMAKVFIPHMREMKWGRFIGINTECSMQTYVTQSAYVSGKRGMDGVFRVLAKEVGVDNITVNQIAPGWTVSDNDRLNNTPRNEAYEAKVPLARRGTDIEIANAVCFIASPLADFISGVYLPVSGGSVMPAI